MKINRNCNNCNNPYQADSRNVKRGWGLCCSKSCAASMREKSKPGYDPKRVERNNIIREERQDRQVQGIIRSIKREKEFVFNDIDDSMYWDGKDFSHNEIPISER